MEFMQRLAALVPRPRLHLIRFHGVLAPNAKLRSKVVPARRATAGHSHEGECKHAHSAPVRMTWARLLKRVFEAADFTRRAARVSRGKRAVRRNLRAVDRRCRLKIHWRRVKNGV